MTTTQPTPPIPLRDRLLEAARCGHRVCIESELRRDDPEWVTVRTLAVGCIVAISRDCVVVRTGTREAVLRIDKILSVKPMREIDDDGPEAA